MNLIPPFVWPGGPAPSVQPFTFKDGLTYLQRLERIVKYIDRVIVPFVNNNYTELAESFTVIANDLIAQVNAAVQAILDESIELQDEVVATLISDLESETRIALEAIFNDTFIASVVEDANSDTQSAIYDLVKDVVINDTSIATHLNSHYNIKSVHNLHEFGAVGDGVADDTVAVQEWIDAIHSGDLEGYAPPGIYLINDTIVKSGLSNRVIRGGGQRSTIFKANDEMNRVFDFRGGGGMLFEGFAIDGNLMADIALDLSTEVGSSTRSALIRVRTLNALDAGYVMDNCGDTIMDDCNAGPFPATATVCHWSNEGGNSYIKNPTWFPYTASPIVVGNPRAALEASFQNLKIEGGALMGIECIDNENCQMLTIDGVQLYPVLNGPNIRGPRSSRALGNLVAQGASKFAVHTDTQSIFGGRFSTAIVIHGSSFNSGTSGPTNVFGGDFVAGIGGVPTQLIVDGAQVRSEPGAVPSTWNDSSQNIRKDYRGFQDVGTRKDEKTVQNVGSGEAGTGIRVGLPTNSRIRNINSVAVTDVNFSSIDNGESTSVLVSVPGTTPGNFVEARGASPLPPGCALFAESSTANTVRLTLMNMSGTTQDVASQTYRIYVMGV